MRDHFTGHVLETKSYVLETSHVGIVPKKYQVLFTSVSDIPHVILHRSYRGSKHV